MQGGRLSQNNLEKKPEMRPLMQESLQKNQTLLPEGPEPLSTMPVLGQGHGGWVQ